MSGVWGLHGTEPWGFYFDGGFGVQPSLQRMAVCMLWVPKKQLSTLPNSENYLTHAISYKHAIRILVPDILRVHLDMWVEWVF